MSFVATGLPSVALFEQECLVSLSRQGYNFRNDCSTWTQQSKPHRGDAPRDAFCTLRAVPKTLSPSSRCLGVSQSAASRLLSIARYSGEKCGFPCYQVESRTAHSLVSRFVQGVVCDMHGTSCGCWLEIDNAVQLAYRDEVLSASVRIASCYRCSLRVEEANVVSPLRWPLVAGRYSWISSVDSTLRVDPPTRR